MALQKIWVNGFASKRHMARKTRSPLGKHSGLCQEESGKARKRNGNQGMRKDAVVLMRERENDG